VGVSLGWALCLVALVPGVAGKRVVMNVILVHGRCVCTDTALTISDRVAAYSVPSCTVQHEHAVHAMIYEV